MPSSAASSPVTHNASSSIPSSSSSSSAFRRLPTLAGLSKPRSPFKRSTAPSPAPAPDLAPGGVNELAGLAAAEGYSTEKRSKDKHRQASSAGGGGGMSSLLGAVGLGSGSPAQGSHAAHMQALRNGGRSTSDKAGTSSMPSTGSGSGGWLASSSTTSSGSTIGRRSASRRLSGETPSASGSSVTGGPREGEEEVVDIGFDTSAHAQPYTVPPNIQARSPPRQTAPGSAERTPTRERANPFTTAYAFPPRTTEVDPLADWQAARTQRLGSGDSTHALAPPAVSAAAKRRSIVAANTAALLMDAHERTPLSAQNALPELGPVLPSSPADDQPEKTARETIRAKRRSQRFDLGEPLPTTPMSAPGDLSASYRLPPQADSSRRPSYEPPLPPPQERSSTRSRQGSASAGASRSVSRKPSRSGDNLAQALEERLNEAGSAPAIPRRKSSNRLRRRASTIDGNRLAPKVPNNATDAAVSSSETPDGTASSSGENIDTSRVRNHARQSSRTRRIDDPGHSAVTIKRSQVDQLVSRSPEASGGVANYSQPTRPPLTRDESKDSVSRNDDRRAEAPSETDDPRQPTTDTSSSQRRPRRKTEGEDQLVKSPNRASKPARSRTARDKEAPRSRTAIQMALPNNNVPRAPKSAMYFYQMPFHGVPPPQPLRAHTATLVGQSIYVIGGTDTRRCWEGAAKFDTETLGWTLVDPKGDRLPRLRAHSATLVGKTIYIFGGGDGALYSNEVWALDTLTDRWTRPRIATPDSALPPTRRAHTAVLHEGKIVVFGGGNGQAALNDVWALSVSDPSNLTWTEWQTKGDVPPSKGYHTANLIGNKMVVYGGSDGKTSFSDVHVLDLKSLTWTLVKTAVRNSRLSHTATQVGSYLFIVGGHDGQNYAQEILLLNLVTLAWETKTVHGQMPSGRGYHTAISHDSRLFVMGGYNGKTVFDDIWCLELAASAYLPQVTAFEIDETFQNEPLDDETVAA